VGRGESAVTPECHTFIYTVVYTGESLTYEEQRRRETVNRCLASTLEVPQQVKYLLNHFKSFAISLRACQ